MMEVYVFTVVVTGEDVQEDSDRLRERIIEVGEPGTRTSLVGEHVGVHVTESVRVSKDNDGS